MALLHSTWFYITLQQLYFTPLDSTAFYHRSISLYLTLHYPIRVLHYSTMALFHSTILPSTIVLLHSTWLYITLHWLYFTLLYTTLPGIWFTLLYSTLLYHGSTSLYFTLLYQQLYFTQVDSTAFYHSTILDPTFTGLPGLYITLPWVYSTLLYSILLYHGSTLFYHDSTSFYLTLHYSSTALLHSLHLVLLPCTDLFSLCLLSFHLHVSFCLQICMISLTCGMT